MYLLKSKTTFLLPPTSSKSFIQQIILHFYTDNMQKNTDIYAKHNGFMHQTATAVPQKQHSDSQKMPCCSIKFLLIKCSNHQEEFYFYKIYTCYFLFDGFLGILNQHITFYQSDYYTYFTFLRLPFSPTAVPSPAYFAVSRTENSKMTN